MKEMLKNENLKLLDIFIIYPIANNKLVSPIQVVLKKYGITIIKNDKAELVPTRMTTGWRVCIYYIKLNVALRKDHFFLPFPNQILKKVLGRE